MLNTILHLFPLCSVFGAERGLEPYSTHRIKSVAYFPTKNRCTESELQTRKHSSEEQRSGTSEESASLDYFRTLCRFWDSCSDASKSKIKYK